MKKYLINMSLNKNEKKKRNKNKKLNRKMIILQAKKFYKISALKLKD